MTTENEKSINSLRKIMEEGDELRRFIRPKEAIRMSFRTEVSPRFFLDKIYFAKYNIAKDK